MKNILCIRSDNIGDLLMSYPAIEALKTGFGARITVLTSKAASAVVPFLPGIDHVLATDVPWVKMEKDTGAASLHKLVQQLQELHFDTAIIFTVYSQSALPAAMVAYLAGIPERVAYCRENPYHLLTHWLPDREPYGLIRHQVQRDGELAKFMGARMMDDRLKLDIPPQAREKWLEILQAANIPSQRTIVLHPGVSEDKRKYPLALWQQILKECRQMEDYHFIVTGSKSEQAYIHTLIGEAGENIHNFAGRLGMGEWMAAIAHARLLLSVNTAAIHIGAAVQTPMVVLYAQSNPQHYPWKAKARIFEFPVDRKQQSKNEVIRHVSQKLYSGTTPYPLPCEILAAVRQLLSATKRQLFSL